MNSPQRAITLMRRAGVIASVIAAAVVAAVVVGAIAAVAFFNTDAGRRTLERMTARWTSGTVVMAGLSGRFPDALQLSHLELYDAAGRWAQFNDVTLDWSPRRLLGRVFRIDTLLIGRAEVLRAPQSAGASSGGGGPWPVRVEVARLHVTRADLGEQLAGFSAAIEVEGSLQGRSSEEGAAELAVTRLDGAGRYTASARADATRVKLDVTLAEPARGLLQSLAGLPELGPVAGNASVDGPRNAAPLQLRLQAGGLTASANGTLDLAGEAAALDFTLEAAAMKPAAGLSWSRVSVRGRSRGPWSVPVGTAHARIDGLQVGEYRAEHVQADLQGDRGAVALQGTVDGLDVPGPAHGLVAGAPLKVSADWQLSAAGRPLSLALSHPVVSAQAQLRTEEPAAGTVHVNIPVLAPIAGLARLNAQGHAAFDLRYRIDGETTRVDGTGTLGLAGGDAPWPALLGRQARVAVALALHGDRLEVQRAEVDGAAGRVSLSGRRSGSSNDFAWQASIADLAALSTSLKGHLGGQGRLSGSDTSLSATASLQGELATRGYAAGAVRAEVRLDGLPGAPAGQARMEGTLDGSPVAVNVSAHADGAGGWAADIHQADWRSVHAEGSLELPARDAAPRGRLSIRAARLADLQPFTGTPIEGSLEGTIRVRAGPRGPRGAATALAEIDAAAAGVSTAGVQARQLRLNGTATGSGAVWNTDLRLDGDGLSAGGGPEMMASLFMSGPALTPQLELTGTARSLAGADAQVKASAHFDSAAERLRVSGLRVTYKDDTLKLLRPLEISLRDGVALDDLRLGLRDAELDVAGRLAPALDVAASLRRVTAATVHAFLPDLDASGELSAQARLTGSFDRPTGRVELTGSGLRLGSVAAASLPPAQLQVAIDLAGGSARLDAHLNAGAQAAINASGTLPLSADGAMDVHAAGTADTALANVFLEAAGRRIRGRLTMDATVTGSPRAPHPRGSLRIENGDFQDFAQGVHLADLKVAINADSDQVKLALDARAGPGTMTAGGTVNLAAPDWPVDITLRSHNAEAITSDLLTASVDVDLTVRGTLQQQPAVAGRIAVNHADINIPGSFPPEVAVLDVRRPGQVPRPRSAAPLKLSLDVTVDAPRAVFVRGRGLDAEMGGKLHVGGTSDAPQISGGFDMRRGTVDLAGASLDFTNGKVSFNGTGVRKKIDPTLDFTAQKTVTGVTATLTVSGYADAPKISVSSSPPMPQDEILARLIFGTSVTQLTPLQVAQMGAALASLAGGSGGSGLDPIAAVRKHLGLDRLSVSGGTAGGTSVEAGRYIANRVYVGARESTSGTTQGQIQVDLTRRLKLQAAVGNGTTTAQGVTPDNDPGTNVGLSYQFEY